MTTTPESLTIPPVSGLHEVIAQAIRQAGGWIGFDRFMELALYAPGLGYYANDSIKFGTVPGTDDAGGSDFVTAPELSPLFGRALAQQLAQALQATGTSTIWEFGAGSGALAAQLLAALDEGAVRVERYNIVDLSGTLRLRQQARLAAYGDRVRWLSALPDAMEGVVVGNEVLDAMPVKLIARVSGQWHERGVVLGAQGFVHEDLPTSLRPPVEIQGPHDYLTEIHPQGEAFVATLARHFAGRRGALFFLDYGFPESEYYHPQRHMGTVMCHRAHRADADALADVGLKDITAHVNFTGIALAGQDAGLHVLGYASQARFLLNCGIAQAMEASGTVERANAAKLIHEHEMGELFKVIALGTAEPGEPGGFDPLGFAAGDRTHTL
ncbi:class I SAM-dependent methyltransferase [Variovorax sp. VNK109]|uniref:class I SAM-dependent methyltransferase n=1 Tax=Variovorax sp. VNK109 TaxID=3400919 RepID=UPI003C069468